MEDSFPEKRNGRYCLVNISDLLDIALTIMLKSSKEEILDYYVDLFPQRLSEEDVNYYFKDCKAVDKDTKDAMMKNIDYIINKLNSQGKWITV